MNIFDKLFSGIKARASERREETPDVKQGTPANAEKPAGEEISDDKSAALRESFVQSFKASAERSCDRRSKDYAEYLAENGREDLAELIRDARKNAVLITAQAASDDEIPVGASKSGGYPDLPPEIPYPTLSAFSAEFKNDTESYPESAMQLAAQIDLAEVAPYDKDGALPRSGMLYIFWSGEIDLKDSEGWVKYTFDGENREPFKVIYYDGDKSSLSRTEPPCPYHAKYFDKPIEPLRFSFGCKYEYGISEYEEELEELYDEDGEFTADGSKLLGYPKGSMNVDKPSRRETNLFQFDYKMGSIWGLYWYIGKQDLKEKKFSSVRMVCDLD